MLLKLIGQKCTECQQLFYNQKEVVFFQGEIPIHYDGDNTENTHIVCHPCLKAEEKEAKENGETKWVYPVPK